MSLPHFQVVHSSLDVPETELVFAPDGRFFSAVSHTEQETPWGTFKMELLRDTWCIGMSSVESRGIPETGLYMFSSTAPIDRYHAISRWALTATKNMVDTAGEEWFDALTKGLRDDMRIWTHKVHRREPVLCEADKMLGDFRRWTKQFYSQDA